MLEPVENVNPTANHGSQPPATQAEQRRESKSSCSTEAGETDADCGSDTSVISETSFESETDFNNAWW